MAIWLYFVMVETLHLGITAAITLSTSVAFCIYDRQSQSLQYFDRVFHAAIATCGIILWMLLIFAAVSWRWAANRMSRLCLMLVLKHGVLVTWASIASVRALQHLLWVSGWEQDNTLRYINVMDLLSKA